MLSADDMRLAQHLDKHKAIIMTSEADAYPAYPRGDRRKRPVCWVSQDSFQALSSFGGIKQGRSGYVLVDMRSQSVVATHWLNLSAGVS